MSPAPTFTYDVFALLLALVTGTGYMGLPAGERDAALLRCPPPDAEIYLEWSARSAGRPGAAGIDGLAADPEVLKFVTEIKASIEAGIQNGALRTDRPPKVVASELPRLAGLVMSRPCCVFAKFRERKDEDEPPPKANAPPLPGLASFVAQLEAALIISGGDQADKIAAAFGRLVDALPQDVRRTDLKHQSLPALSPLSALTLHRHKNYFIVGLGEGTIDAVMKRLDGDTGDEPRFGESDRFAEAMKRLGSARKPANLRWIDVRGILTALETELAAHGGQIRQMATTLAVDRIDSVSSITSVVDGQIHSQTFVRTDDSTDGLLALSGGRSIESSDFSHVPIETPVVYALSVNLFHLLQSLEKIVTSAGSDAKESFQHTLHQWERAFDASLEDDIYPGFGDVSVVHSLPIPGSSLKHQLVLSLDVIKMVRAFTAYTGVLDVIQSELREQPAKTASLKKTRLLGERVWYVESSKKNDRFTPAFCMTRDRLFVAPRLDALEPTLKFRKGGGKNFGEKLGKQIAVAEGRLIGLSYVKGKPLVSMLYAAIPRITKNALGAEVQSTFPALPPAKAIESYIGDTVATIVRTDDGILFESRGNLPLPDATLGMLPVPAWYFEAISSEPSEPAGQADDEVPKKGEE